MKVLYTARATATGGRTGHVESDDHKISLSLSSPDAHQAGTNPEQLFAAGYSACFGSAVQAVAKKYQVTGKVTVQAEVHLNQEEQKGYFISVILNAFIADLQDEGKLKQIIQEAHQMCPYSKAIHNNVEVLLKANDKALY